MTQPSVAVSAGFVAVTASLVVMLPLAVREAEITLGVDVARARKRARLAFALASAALLLEAGLAASGFLRDVEARPPRLVFLFPPALVACLVVALGPSGKRLALGLPAAWLVGYQAFRVPVELVLHRLHAEGVLPVQMTYLGRNLDVLTGLTALPVAWLAAKGRLPRWGLVAWNLAGVALLANIVVVAILCMPYPFRRFTEGPANEVVLSWPFVWLPGFLVPAALLGHLLCLRKAFGRGGGDGLFASRRQD